MLNAAVIGLGWWGKHIINCLEESDRIKIVQTMDISSNEAGKFASEKGLSFTTEFKEVLQNYGKKILVLFKADIRPIITSTLT